MIRSSTKAALAALALAACANDRGTAVRLELTYDAAWGLDRLDLQVGDVPASTEPANTIVVLLPDAWAGRATPITVVALRAGERHAAARVGMTPELGKEIAVDVVLTRLPCGAWCTPGATTCLGDGVAACEQRDSDQCMAWSAPVPCSGAAPSCSLGVCVPQCIDECAAGERRCDGPLAEAACGNADGDACRDWQPSVACAAGETCSNGACRATCADECAAGATVCRDNGVATCGDLDFDGCLEWGPAAPCEGGTTCSNGACSAECADECTGSTCDGLTLKTCGNFDLDPCKDLSPGTSCVPADPCREGMCTVGGCASAPKVCTDPPASVCADGSTARSYDAAGTCTATGTCEYPAHDLACPGGCTGGGCAGSELVSTGNDHTCGVKRDGTVACWGYNSDGRSTPPPGAFASVTGGMWHTCGVRVDGTVACWGYNASGQASPPDEMFAVVSAGADHTCGVTTTGTVVCWGGNASGQATPPLGSFATVSSGGSHTCGLRTTGAVACWGRDAEGQASPPAGTFESVTVGDGHGCALKSDGTVVCWGYNADGRASPPPGAFASVSGGGAHSCGVKRDGTVACWGRDVEGQASPPGGVFASVSAGRLHTCGVNSGGTVACWGDNAGGQASPPAGPFKH